MAKTDGFKYQKRSKDAVRERANRRAGDFDSILKPQYKTYKPKEGKNLVRVLPPTWDEAEHYGFDIFVNYGIGVDNQSYLSLSKMKQQKDPLEEARRTAERAGDKKLSKALVPTQRSLMWIIDRMNEDEGPLLWAAPFTLDKAFANLAIDEDTKECVFVDDPVQGNDIRFYKEGTGMLTKYDASKMRLMKAAPLHEEDEIKEDWLQFVEANPVPSCLQFYDYDHIAAVFDGTVRTGDDEENKKPSRDTSPSSAPDSTSVDPDDDGDEVEVPNIKVRNGNGAPVTIPNEKGLSAARSRQRISGPSEEVEGDESPTPESRPTGGSIRERLQRRRTTVNQEDDN